MEDETQLLLARLMEGGREDEETVQDLNHLTKLLNDDFEASRKGASSITRVIDADCVDTLLCYLDVRQPELVRGHATLTTSAYLKTAGEDGNKKLAEFFNERISRGTYDDYIVAFCGKCIPNRLGRLDSMPNSFEYLMKLTAGNSCRCTLPCGTRCHLAVVSHGRLLA